MFIEVVGADPSKPATTSREDVCAISQNSKCVPALELEEAGQMAGGMETLAAAVAHDESALAAVGRSVLEPSIKGTVASWQAGAQLGGEGGAGIALLGSAASVTTGLARGSYVAASSDARYLDQVDANSLGSRVKWYWHNNRTQGFVYFPDGKYAGIRVIAESGGPPVELSLAWPQTGERTFEVRPPMP